jgi:hypothetical protein
MLGLSLRLLAQPLRRNLGVAVHCFLEVLIERQKQRGERRAGSAKRDFETIHVGKVYDLELDTGDSVDANVDRLLADWRSAKRSSSFHSHKIRAKVDQGSIPVSSVAKLPISAT